MGWVTVAVGLLTFIAGLVVQEFRRRVDQKREDRLREAGEAREDRLRFHAERLAATAALSASVTKLVNAVGQGTNFQPAYEEYLIVWQRVWLLYPGRVQGLLDDLTDAVTSFTSTKRPEAMKAAFDRCKAVSSACQEQLGIQPAQA
jgi:hypothetical protein